MKIFYCNNCKKEIGQMEKGKIIKGAVIICPSCFEKINKTKDFEAATEAFKNAGNTGSTGDFKYNPNDFGDIFGDMFSGKFGKK